MRKDTFRGIALVVLLIGQYICFSLLAESFIIGLLISIFVNVVGVSMIALFHWFEDEFLY